ncbi:phytoene desaturase family protein [Actinocatenispora rupis]|uniref:Phytoene dehydrogenase n=1 Tax=Actinocatenispora rupis TaxID=519421 RepID=A0A8J3J4Z1_9ACTN|nr:phytoene desaturase family protein [Actinocatenispora rupis]GID10269.1 phytoene dehydrogenase [Actinocatenispora rupis]
MRTVAGPTDRVVVVGAGLGGLSCAIRLAAAGRRVTVLERASVPGGRAGLLARAGYRFDTGPTVLTLPHLIADTLATVGEDLTDWLDLVRLDPAYRAHFADGSTLDVRTDTAAMAGEIARLCGSREADGYLRFVDFARELYRIEWYDFIDRNLDGPLDLLTPNLARLVARGGLRPLSAKVGQYLRDPRTRRIFSFQAMYAGLAPHRALALYAVISYLDTVAGVYFPRGGMHAVPTALAAVAEKHGVEIAYDTEVSGVEVSGGRARAVTTVAGQRIPADAVVLNPDLPVARRDLLHAPVRRPLTYSPSCVVLHVGATAAYAGAAHHNIHFGRAWRGTFDEVIRRGRVMSDPSLLVTNPTRTDPSLAPPGRHGYYVLAPAPNLVRGRIDWAATGPRYADELLSTLERRGYRGLTGAVELREVVTPADWAAAGMAAGTPFAAAHTFAQTGPMRPGNLAPGLDNVVFVGSGTQPGVGVPMVLVSGRLAAQRITG